jgi:hypothetical protein
MCLTNIEVESAEASALTRDLAAGAGFHEARLRRRLAGALS